MERSVFKMSVTKDQQAQRKIADGSWEMGVCGTHESTKKKTAREEKRMESMTENAWNAALSRGT